jgi:hypothetical protein
MKSLVILLITIFSSFSSIHAQLPNPVKWSATFEKLNDEEGYIHIRAEIEKGWHTYSQRPTDVGPIPTSFTFAPSKDYELIGKTEENGAHEEFVKAFDAKIFVFTGIALFRQKIKLNSKGKMSIPFKVEFMCCDDMMCLPPKTLDMTVTIKP